MGHFQGKSELASNEAHGGSSGWRRWEDGAVKELSKVFHSCEQAMELARNAGFPLSRIPAFTTPFAFWTKVAQEAHNGMIHGGLPSIVAKAAELYPANPIFAHCQGHSEQASPCTSTMSHKAQVLLSETSDHNKRIKAEAIRLKDETDVQLREAQAQLARARAFRELACAVEALRHSGHEIFIDNEDGKDLRIIIVRRARDAEE